MPTDSKDTDKLIARIEAAVANPASRKKAAVRSAMRAVGILKRKTPADTGHLRKSWSWRRSAALGRKGIVAQVRNDAPYAGIIEKGSRPHWPPWEAMVRYIARQERINIASLEIGPKYGALKLRKLSPKPRGKNGAKKPEKPPKAASARAKSPRKPSRRFRKATAADASRLRAMAMGLAKKIATEGTKPRGFVRALMPRLRRAYEQEAIRQIKADLRKAKK